MRKMLRLAIREYNAAVRTKAFFIMIVLVPFMMSGGLIAIRLSEKHVDTTDKRIVVVDRSGAVAPALVQAAEARNKHEITDAKSGKKTRPAYVIEVVAPDDADPQGQRVTLSDRVRRKELWAFVEIGPQVLDPKAAFEERRVVYYAENAALDDARDWLQRPLNNHLRDQRLAAAGVAEDARRDLLNWTGVEPLGLVSRDASGAIQDAQRANEGRAIGVPMAMLMLMFMMVMVGAMPLVSAVLEEKMQRIAEVLLGSVRPFHLMLGKLLGTLAVSFTVLAIYLGAGLAALHYLGWMEYVPLHLLPWFIVYMLAAILLFGSLLIALGAACNDLKEAQSLMMPVWLLLMIPMFTWLPVVKEPASGFATTLSLIPPFTPILMMLRQTTPVGVPAWQPWVGLAGVLVCTTLCVWAAGRVFRVGILMQGKPPRLGTILRWAIRG